MPGLIDSDTGLSFGEGLAWSDVIGGATLIITPEVTQEYELVWGGASDVLMWGALTLIWGS